MRRGRARGAAAPLAAAAVLLLWRGGSEETAAEAFVEGGAVRRGLLLASLGLLSPPPAAGELPAAAESSAPAEDTATAECRRGCLRDWCNVDTRVCDCRPVLAAAGYSPPLPAAAAAAAAGRAAWPAELGWEGAKLPRWSPAASESLAVRESSLAGAGQGLFAAAALPGGALLPPYQGLLLTAAEVKQRFNTSEMVYMWCPSGTLEKLQGGAGVGPADEDLVYCVDGALALERNPARLVNAAASEAQCRSVNVEMCELGKVMYFRTTRPVAQGEELITDYGANYWEDFGGCAPVQSGESRVIWIWLQSLRRSFSG